MPRLISRDCPLVLGSASPRRRDILTGLGIAHLVQPGDIAEHTEPGERAQAYIERIVEAKLEAVLSAIASGKTKVRGHTCAAVLCADTIVVIDDDILGKPVDESDAFRLLTRIAGRTHSVFTRYVLRDADGLAVARTVRSDVTLRAATPLELSAYAATGEGLDKAGAYAAQGIGSFLVREIRGSYSNVVGLPACELVEDLVRVGWLSCFPLPQPRG